MAAYESKAHPSAMGILWECDSDTEYSRSPFLLIPGNRLFIKVKYSTVHYNSFWLYFESTVENLQKSFNVKYDSPTTGYTTQHGFDQQLYYSRGL